MKCSLGFGFTPFNCFHVAWSSSPTCICLCCFLSRKMPLFHFCLSSFNANQMLHLLETHLGVFKVYSFFGVKVLVRQTTNCSRKVSFPFSSSPLQNCYPASSCLPGPCASRWRHVTSSYQREEGRGMCSLWFSMVKKTECFSILPFSLCQLDFPGSRRW